MIKSRRREILYCDDTEEQRYAMRRILEGAGYTVLEAATGAEALQKLHPGVLAVVMDVRLPDISGYEACRRIKANPATAAIPVLQISASYADPMLRAKGLEGGADAYVAQPVYPAELLSLVGALIRSHDSERTVRFQAEISRQLSQSLDFAETVRAVETAFVPRFADRAEVLLRPVSRLAIGSHDHFAEATARLTETGARLEPLEPALEEAAAAVARSGNAELIRRGSIHANGTWPAKPFEATEDILLAPLSGGPQIYGDHSVLSGWRRAPVSAIEPCACA